MIRTPVITVVVALHGLGATCCAKPSFEFVRDWLVREREAARRLSDLPLCEIVYSVEVQNRVTEADVLAAEEKARTSQDGGDYLMLQMLKSRLGKPNPVEHRRAWVLNDRNWRINNDPLNSKSSFTDVILRERWACMSSIEELAVFDPRVGYPEFRDVRNLADWVLHPVGDLLHGGLSVLPDGKFVRDGFESGDGRFRIRYRADPPNEGDFRIEGDWLDSEKRGLVRRITQLRPDLPGGELVRAVCEDWVLDPETGRWFATTVTEFQASGGLDRIFRFETAAKVSRAEFERVTALPSPVKGDAVRGPIAYIDVHDYRVNPQERIRRSSNQELPRVHRWRSVLKQGGVWQSAGWAAFGGLVLALVILYLRRRVAG